jgi:hypothetical protein
MIPKNRGEGKRIPSRAADHSAEQAGVVAPTEGGAGSFANVKQLPTQIPIPHPGSNPNRENPADLSRRYLIV